MRFDLKVTWKRLALLPVIAIVGALAVGGSGFVSIAANTGHFAIVEWFLHWTMQNAVRTQSLDTSVPAGVDLSDPSLVQRAAGHFASSCASCHGAPGVAQSPSVQAMMPPPPRLEGQIGEWEDRELYWIVNHGIKYSGMPAWTTQDRPDEIWAMAAFLRALPDMSEQEYRALALGGDGAAAPPSGLSTAGFDAGLDAAIADCARCHGPEGHGVGEGEKAGAFPSIAGQPEAFLLEALRAYADGSRTSGIMETAAGIYDDETLAELAAHYSGQPIDGTVRTMSEPRGVTLGEEHRAKAVRHSVEDEARSSEPAPGGVDAIADPATAGGPPYSVEGLAALGRRIATEGLPERKLPSCESCHGAEGVAKNPAYPYLGGQPEWFIASQLQLFKDGTRGGGPFAHLMDKIAIHLTEEHIDALALHYSLQPAGR